MISESTLPQICSEVYEILNVLGKKYIDAIPKNILKNILEKRDLNYTNKFNINEGITEKTYSKDTINILLVLDLEYWSTEEQKKQKSELYRKNDEKYQSELREKYNPDSLFRKKEDVKYNSNTSIECVNLEESKKNSFIKNVFEFIRNFFRKKTG